MKIRNVLTKFFPWKNFTNFLELTKKIDDLFEFFHLKNSLIFRENEVDNNKTVKSTTFPRIFVTKVLSRFFRENKVGKNSLIFV